MTGPQGPGPIPAGWYPDPSGSGQQRYWDGSRWTEHYAPGAGGFAGPAAAGPGGFGQPAHASAPAGVPPPAFFAVPVGALLTLIGSFGTWVKVEVSGFGGGLGDAASANGLEGDGWFTLICALIVAALIGAWFATRAQALAIAAGVIGVISTLVAFYHVVNPSGDEGGGVIDFRPGWGVWMALLGSLLMTAGSFILVAQSGRRA